MKRTAHNLLSMEPKQQRALQAALGYQQLQTEFQMQPVNKISTIHAGSSSITTMPPTMSGHESPSITPSSLCPMLERRMADYIAPIMPIENGQTDAMVMLDRILKSLVSSSSPGVHPRQVTVQPRGSHTQNKLSAMQTQPINFCGGYVPSVSQSQGQPVVQPNWQQNLPNQNSRGTCKLPQHQPRMNQQGSEVNQQMNKIAMQNLAANQADVTNTLTGHPREGNSQQNAGLSVGSLEIPLPPAQEQLVTMNQQSSLHASMVSVGKVDWRDEMLHQMKTVKDAYFSELIELYLLTSTPKITKEKFESLPKEEAEKYRVNVHTNKRVRTILDFLQLEKNSIPEHLRGHLSMCVEAIQNVLGFYGRKMAQWGVQSQIMQENPQTINVTGYPARSTGFSSSQQKQPEQPLAFHLRPNTTTRTSAVSQENHTNILLGTESSCVTVKSPGSVQLLRVNMLQDYRTPPHVTKESPVEVSSPSASIKSTLPPPVAMFGLQTTTASAPDRPTSPSTAAKRGDLKVASPPASVSTLPSSIEKQNNGAAVESEGYTTNSLMPAALPRAETAELPAQVLQHGRAETPVTMKPIDRLIHAVRASSPAELKSSAASMCSVISVDDWVPDGELNTFQQQNIFSKLGDGSSPPNESKRLFETTALCHKPSPPLADTGEDETDLEHRAKRQKTQPIVTPMKLLVPADYPRSSPVLVPVKRGERLMSTTMFSDISGFAEAAFWNALAGIPEPRSITETARAWDTSVRSAVAEFSRQVGGGTFSSTDGWWETYFRD